MTQPQPTNTYFFQTMMKKDTNGAVTKTDNFGWAPIHYAAYHNKLAIINIILKNNIDPNQVTLAMRVPNTISARPLHERTRTPLHFAAMEGNWSIALSLLKAGADCKRLDEDGFMPIVYAMLARQDLQQRLKKKKSSIAESVVSSIEQQQQQHMKLLRKSTKETQAQMPQNSSSAQLIQPDPQEKWLFTPTGKTKGSSGDQSTKQDLVEEKKLLPATASSLSEGPQVEMMVIETDEKGQKLILVSSVGSFLNWSAEAELIVYVLRSWW